GFFFGPKPRGIFAAVKSNQCRFELRAAAGTATALVQAVKRPVNAVDLDASLQFRTDRRVARARTAARHALGLLWWARVAARDDWTIRRHFVQHHPTAKQNRHPHGARELNSHAYFAQRWEK